VSHLPTGDVLAATAMGPEESLLALSLVWRLQVLEDVRYDKNVAVRATAASAWAEFTALPDPPDAEDATPTGRADKVEASTGATTGKPSKASAKGNASGSSPSKNGRCGCKEMQCTQSNSALASVCACKCTGILPSSGCECEAS
jgi:hypothetical protein